MDHEKTSEKMWQNIKKWPFTRPLAATTVCRGLALIVILTGLFLFNLTNSGLKGRALKIGLCFFAGIYIDHLARVNWLRWAQEDTKDPS
jgi:hypothetical protein